MSAEAVVERPELIGSVVRPPEPIEVLPARGAVERRPVVLAAMALLFAAVLGLCLAVPSARYACGGLYVIPIALAGLELGMLAAMTAAGVAVGLAAVVTLTGAHGANGLTLATVIVVCLVVAAISGRFSTRMRAAQVRQRQLLEAGLALAGLRRTDEILAELARQARRLLGIDGVRGEPASASGEGDRGAPTERRVPVAAYGMQIGTLVFDVDRRLTTDDLATLSILILQAVIAVESERTAGLQALLDHQESERERLAEELHEEAAQVLAGHLLELASLERELSPAGPEPRLERMREDISVAMRSLRSVAVNLRPAELGLGLRVALEEIVERQRTPGMRIEVDLSSLREPPPGSRARLVYRALQDALAAVSPTAITLRADDDGHRLVLDLCHNPPYIDPERFGAVAGLIELLDGELSSTPARLSATIPLKPSPPRGELSRAA